MVQISGSRKTIRYMYNVPLPPYMSEKQRKICRCLQIQHSLIVPELGAMWKNDYRNIMYEYIVNNIISFIVLHFISSHCFGAGIIVCSGFLELS
jgi:hypothetical protein